VTFSNTLHEQIDLTGAPVLFALPITFKFPWKKELEEKGEALKPLPDIVEYELLFSTNGVLGLTDKAGIPISSLEIVLAFEKVSDEKRLQELAEILAEEKRGLARKKTTKYKKEAIRNLVNEYASGLPSLMGHEILIEWGVTANCAGCDHSYSITWQNAAKTKAKVEVTRNCKYTWYRTSGAFAFPRSVGRDYDGGSFVCECDNDGNWSIASRE
jgi:hypothetical protein